MKILGVETSCDDTAIAVIEAGKSRNKPHFRVLSNIISGQVDTHAEFGGVVPTLAARDHAKNFAPVLMKALKEAETTIEDIDLIGVTTHPGLMPSLVVGVHATRAVAWKEDKPILGIDHLEGHLAANLLDDEAPKVQFPAIALIVSGGHTQLVHMRSFLDYDIIGATRDDAAGEAFDKVAKLIGLPFPGGPPIAAEAAKPSEVNLELNLPRPMANKPGYDFSFSGLKTAVLYAVRDRYGTTEDPDIPEDEKAALCAAFQQAVVDVLVKKTVSAAWEYDAKTVMLGGGVAANIELRRQLGEALAHMAPADIRDEAEPVKYLLPPQGLSVDNGAMIAATAYLRWGAMSDEERSRARWQSISVEV